MKKRLFGNNIKPACRYCLNGTAIGPDKIECKRYGTVKAYSFCKRFEYSPLKRIPKKEIALVDSYVNQIKF